MTIFECIKESWNDCTVLGKFTLFPLSLAICTPFIIFLYISSFVFKKYDDLDEKYKIMIGSFEDIKHWFIKKEINENHKRRI